jgi:hypothetical protein
MTKLLEFGNECGSPLDKNNESPEQRKLRRKRKSNVKQLN